MPTRGEFALSVLDVPGLAVRSAPAPAGLTRTRPAPFLLRFTAFGIFFFPANMIIKPLGAAGNVPMMLACLLLVVWVLSWLWGLHDPITHRHPGRLAVGIFAITFFASYAALYRGWTGGATVSSLASADRILILVAASIGVILFIGDALTSVDQILSLVRWLLAGAFFCSIVALIQFVFHINPVEWIQTAMPGFTDNGGNTPFQIRGNLFRVAGTAFSTIEFAVVAVMLLPLSIWRALFDPKGARWFHWVQTGFLVFDIAATVTRSGLLGAAAAFIVFIPFLPRVARRWVAVVLPLVVVALFALVPGFVTTISGALGADTSDPSIATRVNNYPRVAELIDARPWLGLGPGNYVPANALQILDNQYLGSLVSTGIVGLIGLIVYLWLPAVTTVYSARKAPDQRQRTLAGAVAAGLAAAGVCSVAFDSLSFPVFALLYPVLVGISGAIWRLTPGKDDLAVATRGIERK
jgi:O-antigen ligase